MCVLMQPSTLPRVAEEEAEGTRRGQQDTGRAVIVSDMSTGFPPRSLDIYIFLRALVILRPVMNYLSREN